MVGGLQKHRLLQQALPSLSPLSCFSPSLSPSPFCACHAGYAQQALEKENGARHGDTREDVRAVIRPSLPCTTCLQTISCCCCCCCCCLLLLLFLWLTVFSPNANTYPVGNLLTNRDIPHSKKAKKVVSQASRTGAPSPLACLPRTPRGSFLRLVLSSVCHAGYVLTGALRGACFVSFVIFCFCFQFHLLIHVLQA